MTSPSPLAARPDHVPEAAVYDFDMHLDAELVADPHERLRRLHDVAPPIFWTPHNGGHWIVIGYQAAFEASRDTATFSSELWPGSMMAAWAATRPADAPRLPTSTPINLDPPEHGRYRAPLQAAFGPKAMMARRDEIRALANSLIDAVIDRGHCDFVAEIAEPLPVQVFLKMMGLPGERQAAFRELVHMFLAPGMRDLTEYERRLRLIADAMKDDILARRDDLRDDLISLLWRSEVDGRPMTYELMEDYAVLLFVAGLDTVINGMGYGIRHIAGDAATQARLRAEPKLIVEAAEELLRRYSFSTVARRVTHDTRFAGVTFREDDRVSIHLPAANLDAQEFPEPARFDLARTNKVHIAFNAGPHRCLGSHLARIELQIVYEQMLARLPDFRLDPDLPATFHGGVIVAIDSLPIRWD